MSSIIPTRHVFVGNQDEGHMGYVCRCTDVYLVVVHDDRTG